MSTSNSSGSDSGQEEVQKPPKVSDYEKQRLKRMAENKARMEAMGLHKMASSLMGSAQKSKKRDLKGKKKVGEEDDEDYLPDADFENDADDDGDDDYVGEDSSGTKSKKV